MLKIVNRTVPWALAQLGYTTDQMEAIRDYIDQRDTVEGAPELKEEHLPVIDCAFKPQNGQRSIEWRAHVAMMAAAQPFLSGAISKTVNMPQESTPQDIADAYRWGWQLGLKALAIYRDGSKQSQPLSTSTEGDKEAEKKVGRPRRERLPDTRTSVTHKFNVSGHEGYITVGLYRDGRPGEVFITMAKEGSTVGGLMDCFGTAISLSLQYGVPLQVLVDKFSYSRFEPMGHTTNPEIRIAKSVVDYIFRWMGMEFLSGYREAQLGVAALDEEHSETHAASPAEPEKAPKSADNGRATNGRLNGNASQADIVFQRVQREFAQYQIDAPPCDNCGAITVRNGNCYLCHNCGNSMGCS
jgi:ribonucleoside-diphosphate reductase alpha chain